MHEREKQFLVSACRGETATDISDLDWPWVLQQSIENGIVSLVCPAAPESIRGQLMDAWAANAAQSLRLTESLKCIVEHLQKREIAMLAYKGPALSMLAYGSVSARAFGDIDILVRRSDVDGARLALEAMGYRCTLSAKKQARFLSERYHLHFMNSLGTNVELHWAITPAYWPFHLDETRLWKHSTTVELLGSKIPTLNRELTLLAICAHGAKERWPRLGLVCDLHHLVLRSPDVDWSWIRQQAAEQGRLRVLLLGLYLADTLLGTPIPADLAAEARADDSIGEIAKKIEDQIFGGSILSGLQFHRYAWHIWNRWPDRSGHLRHAMRGIPERLMTLARPSEADGQLPAGLSWLWRPLRVAFKKDVRRTLRRIGDNL